jgi:apolipoprotein N-acyltransferase
MGRIRELSPYGATAGGAVMSGWAMTMALGAASGVLGVVAYRWHRAWLSWVALAPLAAAAYLASPVAAGVAGTVCGLLVVGGNRLASIPRELPGAVLLEAGMTAGYAAMWGVAFGLAAWSWPDGVPAWGSVAVPAACLAVASEARLGAPRWSSWFHAAQDGVLPLVHIARLGSDLVIPPLLGLAATVPAILLVQLPPRWPTAVAAGAATVVVAAAIAFGRASHARAVVAARTAPTVRVAAVAAAPAETDPRSPAYRDIDALIARYDPAMTQAIARGAQLIVLPEMAAVVTAETEARWLEAVSGWAQQARAPVVAGLSQDLTTNEVVVADETGRIAVVYYKQHPAFFGEPKPPARSGPALLRHDPFPISAAICVDTDYSAYVRPVARAGGVLAIPANDWPEIYAAHQRVTVWPAVLTGRPVVRSSGHGISAVLDGSGRVLASASSTDGPVTLVADVPVPGATPPAAPAPRAAQQVGEPAPVFGPGDERER